AFPTAEIAHVDVEAVVGADEGDVRRDAVLLRHGEDLEVLARDDVLDEDEGGLDALLAALLLPLDAGAVLRVGTGEGHVQVAVGGGVVAVVVEHPRVVAAAVDGHPGGNADLLAVLFHLEVDRADARHGPGAAEAVAAVAEVRRLPHRSRLEGIGDVDGHVPGAAPALAADEHRTPATGTAILVLRIEIAVDGALARGRWVGHHVVDAA